MHSEIWGVVMCAAVFFATPSHASSELPKAAPTASAQSLSPIAANPANKTLEPSPAPNVAAPAPAIAPLAPNTPSLANVDNPLADRPIAHRPAANDPTASKTDGALADLATSKRLAISVLAGVFTLVVALWIGARRD